MIQVPDFKHLGQYLGAWAIQETFLSQTITLLDGMNMDEHIAAFVPPTAEQKAVMEITENGVAIVPIIGAMTKFGSSLSTTLSSIELQKMVRNAARNPKVSAIMLHIDSPGGSVAGTETLAAEIKNAATIKPVVAFIDDMGASAAYWIASSANHIFANTSALVGSLGTFAVVKDTSVAEERRGIKTYVISSEKFKGIGTEGTELTEEQRSELIRMTSSLSAVFFDAVQKGRGLPAEKHKEIFDGRAFVAKDALSFGLIDVIGSFDDAEAYAVTAAKTRRISMSEKEKEESGQRRMSTILDEYRAACPGASSDFILSQASAEATIEKAKTAYIEELSAKLKETETKLHAALSASTTPPAPPKAPPIQGVDGVDPVASSGKTTSSAAEMSATEQFNALVAEKMKEGKTKAAAIKSVVAENRELHSAYLAEHPIMGSKRR